MTEVATLVLQVVSTGVAAATTSLAGLTGAAGTAGIAVTAVGTAAVGATVAMKAATTVGNIFTAMLSRVEVMLTRFAALAIILAPLFAARELVGATKTYQDFQAQLKLATGSAENAAVAFKALDKFAYETPYTLQEAVTAFIRLRNIGLTPSEEALRSFGNTASSIYGKSLMDMIEAVADAVTGQFRRLREFGIVGRRQGDEVAFSFQGVTEKVAFNAKAIEGYLIRLGQIHFGEAMAERMKTLSGVMSNVKDEWLRLWINISNVGGANVVTQSVNSLLNSLISLNIWITSGSMDKSFEASSLKWSSSIKGFEAAWAAVKKTMSEIPGVAQLTSDQAIRFYKFTFDNFPIIVSAAVQVATAYMHKWVVDCAIIADAISLRFKIGFDRIADFAKATGEAIKNGLNPTGAWDGFTAAIEAANKKFEQAKTTIGTMTDQRFKGASVQTDAAIDMIRLKAEKTIADVKKLNDDADALYNKGKAEREARQNDKKDVLAQFGAGGDSTSIMGGANPRGQAHELATQKAELQEHLRFVEEGMKFENLVIADGYREQKRIIMDSTTTTIQEKEALILNLLANSVVTETENIRRSYDERSQVILNATALTENAKTQLMMRLQKARDEALWKAQEQQLHKQLGGFEDFFGNLASASRAFGEKGFKFAQAFSIVQATIKGYEAAVSSYAAGALIGGPILGAVFAAASIAATGAQIAAIKSQHYTATYATGGMIPAGRFGIAGDAGPELVEGPAIVTNARNTRNRLGGGQVTQVVINNLGPPMSAETQSSDERLLVILKPLLAKNKLETKRELTGEVARGGSEFSGAIEQTFGLRRGSV